MSHAPVISASRTLAGIETGTVSPAALHVPAFRSIVSVVGRAYSSVRAPGRLGSATQASGKRQAPATYRWEGSG